MPELSIIALLFVLLIGSVICVTVFRFLRLPTMLGYLIIGVLVGPDAFGLIGTSADISYVAELGVMALLFSLGLEFSFKRMVESKRFVFGLGGSQVAVCLVIFTGIGMAFGLKLIDAILAGAVLTLSSTAVISKMLMERGELNTPQGNRVISVLIFQDLAVIPLLILLASEAGGNSEWHTDIIQSAIVLVILLWIAPKVMPRLVDFFSRQNSNELFTIFVLGMVVGLSLLTYSAGLSLVLGAFLAGMLLAESLHRYMIEEIIRPFREIFLGFFFISIGLLASPTELFEHLPLILTITVALLILKPLIIYVLCKIIGTHGWTASYSAIALGGTGEFGFVLLAATTVEDAMLLQILLGVNLICMIMPPVLLPITEKLRSRLGGSNEWLLQSRDLTRILAQTSTLQDHVILVGYGQNAMIITRMLDQHQIPWVAIESNHGVFTANHQNKSNVVFGDARREEELIALGIHQAKILVVSHTIHHVAVRTIQIAHQLNKDVTIIAKVLGNRQVAEISGAGATFMSVDSLEIGLSLGTRVMQSYNVKPKLIAKYIREIHESTVEVGMASVIEALDETEGHRLLELRLTDEHRLAEYTITSLQEKLQENNVVLLAIIRADANLDLATNTQLAEDDLLYLRGSTSHLQTVESLLLKTEE